MKLFSALATLAFLGALLPTSSAKIVRHFRGTQDKAKGEIVKGDLDVDSHHRNAKASKSSKSTSEDFIYQPP